MCFSHPDTASMPSNKTKPFEVGSYIFYQKVQWTPEEGNFFVIPRNEIDAERYAMRDFERSIRYA